MANERKAAVARAVQLPSDWDSLSIPEKFEVLHKSPDLVRGAPLPGAEVDCRRHMMKDASADFALSFRYPKTGTGNFSYVHGRRPFASGQLESLGSDQHRNQLIFALYEPGFHIGSAKYAKVELEETELQQVADLFQAYTEHCGTPGRHIQTYVILVSRDYGDSALRLQ